MGEYANERVNNFISGRWGMPVRPTQVFDAVRRDEIAHLRFKIVEVIGGNTNRIPGTKLIVCEKNDKSYHVWARKEVTGIAQSVCKTLHEDLDLNQALSMLGRKPYQASPRNPHSDTEAMA